MNELNGMTLPELIDQLEPVIVPPPVSLLPATAGWILLALFIGGVVVLLTLLHRRHLARQRYRHVALAELEQIELRLGPGVEPGDALGDVAAVVRRTALARWPRAQIAHLHGPGWRDFLVASARRDLGTGLDGLTAGPYRADVDLADVHAGLATARCWVRHHHG